MFTTYFQYYLVVNTGFPNILESTKYFARAFSDCNTHAVIVILYWTVIVNNLVWLAFVAVDGHSIPCLLIKMVKFSHTRYRALGPSSQLAGDFLSHLPMVGCGYFPPGLQSPSKPKNVIVLRPVPSYTALWQEPHKCEQLAQGCYAAFSWWKLNPWLVHRKCNALLLFHCAATSGH